jgi:hypothetical protein
MVVDVSLAKEEAAGAKLRIEGDGHPTPLANRLRASIIKDYIENRMPGILVAGALGSNVMAKTHLPSRTNFPP